MTVKFIKRSKANGYVCIGISTEKKDYSLTVSEREYACAGALLTGDSLNEDTLAELLLADEKYRAKLKALRVLSYGDNSENMLMRKLVSSGISRSVAHGVVCEMVSLGYINPHRQLKKLIRYEVNSKNCGPMKLFPKLMAKGYKKSDIEAVIDELTEAKEIDFEEAKRRLIEKADGEEIKKILYKNGYTVC